MPLMSAPSWAIGPASAPVIPKTFHNPGTKFGGGGGGGGGGTTAGSAYFDGTGDSLDVGTFTIGTDAFTIENWFQPKFNTNGSDTVFLYDVSSEDIRVTFKNGNIRAQLGSETELSYSIGTLDYNTWYYTALQRDSSGNVNFYFNGGVVGNYSASGQNVSGNTLRIGDKQAGSKEFVGYISNFRIVKGDALYPQANGGSASFDGTGDYIDTTNPLPVTGDFTIEGWIYPTTSGGYDGYFSTCLDTGASGGIVVGKDKFFVTHGGGSSQIGFTSPIENNVWSHIVLQRSSNVFSLYKDGILQGTTTVTVSLTGSTLRLGSRYTNNTSNMLTGFLSNFRIVDGTALYSPASGSTYFDGTNDHLQVNSMPTLSTNNWIMECWVYTTNTSAGQNQHIYDGRGGGPGSGDYVLLQIDTNENVRFFTDGAFRITSSATLSADTWYHIALERNGTAVTLYVDGVSQGSYDPGGQEWLAPQNGIARIGADDNGTGYFFYGYISNFRVVLFSGINNGPYGGSNFTPPTAPLTAITGTILLTCQNNTGSITDESTNNLTITATDNAGADSLNPFYTKITVPTSPLTAISGTQLLTAQNGTGSITDASSNNYTITPNGNTTASASSPFAKSTTPLTAITNTKLLTCNTPSGTIIDASSNNHTVTTNGDTVASHQNPFGIGGSSVRGSIYFDGSGDYLLTGTDSNLVIGNNDFTAECWIYPTTFASVQGVIDRRRNGDAANYDWTTYLATNATLNFYAAGGTQITSSALSVNTWYHTAVVKNNGTTTLYLDGVSQGTWSDSATYPSNQITFGIYGPSLASLWYNGYMTNFRLVVGTAVYTSNFTVPTVPLTAIANTQLLTSRTGTSTIDDASGNGIPITANGNAFATGFSPFQAIGSTNGAYYFSSLNAWGGTNARVITADSNDFNLPDGTDVTVEFWYKIPVTPPTAGNGYLFDLGDGNYGWLAAYAWNQNGKHTLRIGTYYGVIWLPPVGGEVGMTLNQWYHCAITRQNGIWKVYLDGVLQGTKLSSSLGSFDTFPDRISLGGFHNLTYPNYGVVSYISDFRFVKGLAVYTGNFTPPSGPLTTTGGTYSSTTNVTNPSSAQTLLLTAQNSSGSFVDNSQYSRTLTSYNTVTPVFGLSVNAGTNTGVTHSFGGGVVLSWTVQDDNVQTSERTLTNATLAASAQPGDVVVVENSTIQAYNSYNNLGWQMRDSGTLLFAIHSINGNDLTILYAQEMIYRAQSTTTVLNRDLKTYFDTAGNPRGDIPANATAGYSYDFSANGTTASQRWLGGTATLYRMFDNTIQSAWDTSGNNSNYQTPLPDVTGSFTPLS